jgi:hypothetical protein
MAMSVRRATGGVWADGAGGAHRRAAVGGLDDAVISIHLATRSIDGAAVQDQAWRLLCRGLLTRDPAGRWGSKQSRLLAGARPPVALDGSPAFDQPALPYIFDGQPCERRRHSRLAMPLGRRPLVN